MDIQSIQKIANIAVSSLRQNAPTIITGVAMTTAVIAVIKAVEEAPTIKQVIEEKKQDLRDTDPDDKHTKGVVIFEGIRDVAPSVVKIVVPLAISLVSIFEVNHIHQTRYAAAAALAMASQQKLADWEEATKQVVGPKKVEDVQAAIANTEAKRDPKQSELEGFDGHGWLVYDPRSGFKFHVPDKVKLAEARVALKEKLNDGFVPWVSVEEFYELASDHYTNVEYASEWGWNMGDDVDITWHLGGDNEGNPCWCLDYKPRLRSQASGDLYVYGGR